jgi:hypothetical protein
MFIHDRGYNFFTLNKLTHNEINRLIRAFNAREKEKEHEANKIKNKSKRRR